jgi:predicted CXXCH cytochrome family protein
MKLWTVLTTMAAGITACALGLSAQAATAPTGTSVAVSKHNLSISIPGSTNNAYGTNQVCLPCHTPHQMPDTTVGKLWNHQLNPAASYTLYGNSSSYLTSIDEVSRKCLGCHDGTIAVDSFGGHTGTHGTINAGYVVGAGGNLTHDHPIDVQYNTSGNYTLTSSTDVNGVTTYSPAWSATARNNDPKSFTITGYTSSKWGAKTYTVTALSALSFYTPSGAVTTVSDAGGHSATTASQYVYCRTCHDPHNNLYSFLRVPNDGSQLCLTCHNK